MKKLLMVIAMVLAGSAAADQPIGILFEGSTQREDNTTIEGEVTYDVYAGTTVEGAVVICEDTAAVECGYVVPTGQCLSFGVTATETATGLTSEISNLVTFCAVSASSPRAVVISIKVGE